MAKKVRQIKRPTKYARLLTTLINDIASVHQAQIQFAEDLGRVNNSIKAVDYRLTKFLADCEQNTVTPSINNDEGLSQALIRVLEAFVTNRTGSKPILME